MALISAMFVATPVTATRDLAQATADSTGFPVSATPIEAKTETLEQRIT